MLINNAPAVWDETVDFIAVGSGCGGLSAAITAADHGLDALVLERTEALGGVTAYSMGELWVPGNHWAVDAGIDDSLESGFRYVHALSMGYGDARAMWNQARHGPQLLRYLADRIGLSMQLIRDFPDYYYPHQADAVAEGRYLEIAPFDARQLGDWQDKVRLTPHMPAGLSHHDIFSGGGLANIVGWDYALLAERTMADVRCLGPGLAAALVKGALDLGVDLRVDARVDALIADGERVVGVRATIAGEARHIRAERGVLLAVSGYERDADLSKTLSNVVDPLSMVMHSVDGAHLRLAGPLGARIARVPDPTNLGFLMPDEEHDNGSRLGRGSIPFMGLPHTIVVNQKGRRFANEAFYRSLYYAVDQIDGATQSHPNFPCWAIMDAQARAKYPFGSAMPGEELSVEGTVKADTLTELAALIGVDADGLADTVTAFNGYAERGEDPEFGRGRFPWGAAMSGDLGHRPNPNLGALNEGPYYAVALQRLGGGGITGTGLLADVHARVLGWDDRPLDGLYVAGNACARMDTGALMQSGLSNARGLTQGYLAARHAAGQAEAVTAAQDTAMVDALSKGGA